ncbi:MAG TPA: NmrA/HSCARG family protein [Methanomassiliicoccales archaeon]|nr:NmrA/HSCARG family protein [Methanomassiliicoccales archaeon]
MSRSSRTIVVTGATGKQGSAAVRKLRDRGWEVRGISRDPSAPKAKAIRALGAEVVRGDLSNPFAVRRAMKDAYGVFCVLTWADGGPQMEKKRARIVANAAKEAGVQHFVYSSVGGAERRTGIPHFESKWENEKYINSIGLPWTMLRPVSFFENFDNPSSRDSILAGRFLSPLPPDRPLQMISVEDIGGFACMAFEDRNRWLQTATEIAGDEKTMPQVAEALGRAIGRPVRHEQIPLERLDPERQIMNRWMIENGYRANIPALRRMRPSLMTLEKWLETGPWAAVQAKVMVPA